MQIFSIIPQRLDIGASPTFVGLTITGNSVFGLNSSVFQPTTDSTTFFQVLDAAGAVVGNVDTVNKRWGFGTATPTRKIEVVGTVLNDPLIKLDDGTHTLEIGVDSFASGIVQFRGPVIAGLNLKGGTTGGRFFQIEQGEDHVQAVPGAAFGYYIFEDSSSGETQELRIYGYRTGDASRSLQIGVGIDAADTASFDGLSNYWFNGAIESQFATPYFTLHNDTHEDTDGGRESRLNFKGEQSGGEETTLARIEVSHDGAADDQLGKIVDNVNTGAGLATVMTRESNLDVFFEKVKLTAIGGYAIKLTNNTGSNSVEGQVVEADDTDENSYKTADANALDAIGVVYNAGVADGSEVWIVIAGIAEVLLDAGGCVHHDRLIASATAGSADVSNAPAVAVHFQEIGHAIETVVGAGLAKAVIHFL